jgi:hypothetical protein
MPYEKEISREFPTLFVFVLDQSGSMGAPFGRGGAGISKAQGLADATNRLIQDLLIRCESNNRVLNRYFISLIGYGRIEGDVKSAFVGPLAGKTIVSAEELYQNPARIEDQIRTVSAGDEGSVDEMYKVPIWVDPVFEDGTPMTKALFCAKDVVEDFVKKHPASFPPIVFHMTDGASTDGIPMEAARKLTQVASNDGSVLLFNLHISSERATPIEFPDSEANLPDHFAKLLFNMSSILPEYMRNAAHEQGYQISPQTRGFAFNADMTSLLKFLKIGTIPKNLG